MTPEELKAALDAFKSETATAIASLKASDEAKASEIDRLRGANKRLLVDLKKAKVKVRPAATEDDEGETDDEGDADAPPDKTGDSRIAALEKQLADERAKNNEKATKAAIADALEAAKISATFRPAVAALLRAGRKIEVNGDDVLIDGQPAKDAVTAWAATDEGKVYVSAPASGVKLAPNARPGNTAGNVAGKKRGEFSDADKGKFIRENGAKAWLDLPK